MSALPNLSRLSLSVGGDQSDESDDSLELPAFIRKKWPEPPPQPQQQPQPKPPSNVIGPGSTIPCEDSDPEEPEPDARQGGVPAPFSGASSGPGSLEAILAKNSARMARAAGLREDEDKPKSGSETEKEESDGDKAPVPALAGAPDAESQWARKRSVQEREVRDMNMRKDGTQKRNPNKRSSMSLSERMDLVGRVRALYATNVTSQASGTPGLVELEGQFRNLYKAMVASAAEGGQGLLAKLIDYEKASQEINKELVTPGDWKTRMYALAGTLASQADRTTLKRKIDVMITKLAKSLHLGQAREMQQKKERVAAMRQELRLDPVNAWCTIPAQVVEELDDSDNDQ